MNDILQPSNDKMYAKVLNMVSPSYNEHIFPGLLVLLSL